MTLHHPNGQIYPLSFYGDTENGQTVGTFTWDADEPRCPECRHMLITDDAGHAPIEFKHAGAGYVVCDCGWEQELSARRSF